MRLDTEQRYLNVVRNVEEAAQQLRSSTDLVRIEQLCRECKVTERLMRKAFQASYGATPYQYLRFSVEYRAAYGESPSTTLRRAL